MMNRIVGIVGTKRAFASNFSQGIETLAVPHAFLDIMRANGATSVILPSEIDPMTAPSIIDRVDALVLSSGQDIAAEMYNEECLVRYSSEVLGSGKLYERPLFLAPNRVRDLAEISYYAAARARGIPVLGICRGMQLMNVAEGGALHQEIESTTAHFNDPDGWIHYHTITIDLSTRLGAIIDASEYTVSSVHHQGISRLAGRFKAVAHAPDGLVEMIEDASADVPVWGIQGHPEKIGQNFPRYADVFRVFVEALFR